MLQVINRCREASAAGHAPFAACVVRGSDLLSCEHNLVEALHDPTAHAEVLAIRGAAEKLGSHDLSECTLYATCEPCPMCFAAAHFARIARIVYGATIGDAALAGFDQLPVFASQLKLMGRSPVELTAEYMRDDCVALLTGQARP